MGKGVQLGLQYLSEGYYDLRGGKGNKVLREFKVEDGKLYILNNGEFVEKEIPPMPNHILKIKDEKRKYLPKVLKNIHRIWKNIK